MMNRFVLLLVSVPVCGVFAACSSTTNTTGTADAGTSSGELPLDGSSGGEAAASDGGSGGTSCTSARDQLLVPINKVSTGTVSVVSDNAGTKTLYVDASAGGLNNAIKNPRIYVDLAAGTRVDVTDTNAPMSTAWDLALKRDRIFTNSGDAGIGTGGAAQIAKTFSSVAAAEANAEPLFTEKFFDADCNPQLDMTSAVATTFSDWYDYDQVTHIPTPKDVTYVVRGGTGTKYKVAIKAYDGSPDGGKGAATGFYILEVSAL
ncbi:MAG: hypothetical protein QOI41_7693 [Myxococcales bacterium]|nr:hypothetical protein [Myxococcales bacterium]